MSFKREDRYTVLKISDVAESSLTNEQREELIEIEETVSAHRIAQGKPPLEAVVIESDWPEYEKVWDMLERRVNGEQHSCKDPALDTAAETNIKRLSYIMHNHQLAMVVAKTLLESGRAAEAATWLRNTLVCYEGKWPHSTEDMDQWVAQQMEGVHWPPNPSISEARLNLLLSGEEESMSSGELLQLMEATKRKMMQSKCTAPCGDGMHGGFVSTGAVNSAFSSFQRAVHDPVYREAFLSEAAR